MKKTFKAIAIAAVLFAGASLALAQTDAAPQASTTPSGGASIWASITFPIAELGSCTSRESCRVYCDVTANSDACLAYAQKAGLMSKEKIAVAKIVLQKKGPGNCSSRESCVAYCLDSSHLTECLAFAQSNKIISDEKVSLIKKLSQGEGPGACKSADTCQMFCEDSSHLAECKAFAEENGLAPAPKRMASSTPPRMGTSTPPNQPKEFDAHMKNASTTPPVRPLPPKAPGDRPSVHASTTSGLGASVLQGFARLLGF